MNTQKITNNTITYTREARILFSQINKIANMNAKNIK